jgi:hypothetical protein
MGTRINAVVLAVGLLVIGFGVVDTQASRRHAHKVVVKRYFNDIVLPAANDPATGGVASVDTGCPRHYRATGGGYQSSNFAVVPYADLFTDGYGAIAVNQTDTAGKLTVHVACIAGKTKAAAAGAGRHRLDRMVERYRSQLRH